MRENGLLARYPLTYASGIIVRDVAGNRNGMFFGFPRLLTTSSYGYPFDLVRKFDAINDQYTDIGTHFDFSGQREFTFTFWMLALVSVQNDGAGLICKGTGAGGEQYCIDIRSDGSIRFFTRESGGGVNGNIATPIGVGINNTKWNHLAATFSGAALSQRLYLNGALSASAVVTDSLQASSNPTTIGARQSGVGIYDFAVDAFIYQVRVYSRALAESEVNSIYRREARLVFEPDPLTAFWPKAPAAAAAGAALIPSRRMIGYYEAYV